MVAIMEQEIPSEEAAPPAVIVGHFQSPSTTDAPLAKNPVQSTEATDSGHGKHEPQELTATPPFVVGHQVQRLKIASLVFGVSLFLNWGIAYWVQGLFYGEF